MEIVSKKNPGFIILLCAIIHLFSASFIHAQDEQSGYQIIATEEGLRLYQTIAFPFVPNTVRYTIEIEQVIGDHTFLIETIGTTVNYFEVSLRAGNYRYRISAFNRMNIIEARSEWQDFEIIIAETPAIHSYQPFYALYFDLDDPNAVLIVNGADFYPESEFALIRQRRGYDWTNIELSGRSDVVFPTNVSVTNDQARLTFVRGTIARGTYEIFIRNPGGFWTVFGTVTAGYSSTSNFTFSMGYSPLIAGFDFSNYTYDSFNPDTGLTEQQQYLNLFNPEGNNLRIGWLPLKTAIGSFGLELQLHIHTEYWGWFNVSSLSMNLLYQFQIGGRWQQNIRLGFGIGLPYNDDYYLVENEDFLGTPFIVGLGFSTQYFLWKNLYLEAGLDIQYTHSFNSEFPINHITLRPGINIGWQFGRWMDYSEVSEGMLQGNDYSTPVARPPRTEYLFSLIWHPVIPWYGMDLYGDYTDYDGNRIQMLQNFNPLSFSLHYAWFPYRWNDNKLGIGFTLGVLHRLSENVLDEELQLLDLLSLFTFGFYYQRVLPNNWQVGAHIDVGISNPYDYNVYFMGPALSLSFGASVQYFFFNDMFVEAGIDMTWNYYDETFRSILRPRLAIGIQLNRDNETGLRLPTDGFPSIDFGSTSDTTSHYLSIGWSPSLTLFGINLAVGLTIDGEPQYTDERYLNSFNFAGFSLRYAYIPMQWGRNKLGFDAEIHLLDHRLRNEYSKSLISEATFGIRYQIEINDFWQINSRIAAGVSQSYDLGEHYVFQPNLSIESVSTYSFALNAGTSVQYFFWGGMYAEAGLDLTFIFADELKSVFRPSISIGYRINRVNNNP